MRIVAFWLGGRDVSSDAGWDVDVYSPWPFWLKGYTIFLV